MRIESVSPSKQLLRACFEQGINFKVQYRGGVIVAVEYGDFGWRMTRSKHENVTSDICVDSVCEGTFADIGSVNIASQDALVQSMARSMYAESGLPPRPNKEQLASFCASFLDIYGGQVKHITAVHKTQVCNTQT